MERPYLSVQQESSRIAETNRAWRLTCSRRAITRTNRACRLDLKQESSGDDHQNEYSRVCRLDLELLEQSSVPAKPAARVSSERSSL